MAYDNIPLEALEGEVKRNEQKIVQLKKDLEGKKENEKKKIEGQINKLENEIRIINGKISSLKQNSKKPGTGPFMPPS